MYSITSYDSPSSEMSEPSSSGSARAPCMPVVTSILGVSSTDIISSRLRKTGISSSSPRFMSRRSFSPLFLSLPSHSVSRRTSIGGADRGGCAEVNPSGRWSLLYGAPSTVLAWFSPRRLLVFCMFFPQVLVLKIVAFLYLRVNLKSYTARVRGLEAPSLLNRQSHFLPCFVLPPLRSLAACVLCLARLASSKESRMLRIHTNFWKGKFVLNVVTRKKCCRAYTDCKFENAGVTKSSAKFKVGSKRSHDIRHARDIVFCSPTRCLQAALS
jgi:hypothetical protein